MKGFLCQQNFLVQNDFQIPLFYTNIMYVSILLFLALYSDYLLFNNSITKLLNPGTSEINPTLLTS